MTDKKDLRCRVEEYLTKAKHRLNCLQESLCFQNRGSSAYIVMSSQVKEITRVIDNLKEILEVE